MAIQIFTAYVESIHDLTHDVRQLDLRLDTPDAIRFTAGQFISFEIPHPKTNRLGTRPYSIASSPHQPNRITLLFNRVPEGLGSGYLFQLKVGDKTSFKGPAGNFVLREDPGRDRLFVATGVGIAPFRSMLFAQAEEPHPRSVTLVWGLRSQRDLYYQAELAEWARRLPSFTAVTTLSRAEPGWSGESGRVLRVLDERITSVANRAVYLCGNSAMIHDAQALLQTKGLCPIYREKFFDDRDAPED